mgnify:CR=1 FL=1
MQRVRRVLGLVGLCVAGALQAAVLSLPAEGDLVGETLDVVATHDDTIIDLARRYGLGYEEVVNANPGVDPWLPGEGTVVRMPSIRNSLSARCMAAIASSRVGRYTSSLPIIES